jgi:NAD(P)-dependent dehydrogenase (short-subunit alcohol dehydrogenase family)/uncharacterized protein YndB with AHSA1/START domain
MNEPIVLDECIEVERPLHEVFAYIADFAHIEEWDPAVRAAQRLTEGPPRVGSEYRIDMRAGFSLHYRIVGFEPGRVMRMQVRSRPFDAEEEIRFETTAEGGTRVRYIARFSFLPLLAALSRRFPAVMDQVGKETMRGMAAALADRFEAPRSSRMRDLGDYLLLPGLLRFTALGYRRARRHWRPMSAWLGGRHVVITGASAGLGLAAAGKLAALGASLTLVVRDARRGADTVERLRRLSGNEDIRCEVADLESMAAIHSLADRLLAAGRPIDVLINNAGALFNPRRETAEGLEASFALLLLGPKVLTERLQPLLAAAGKARVVNVLSGGMYTQRVRPDDLESRRGAWSGAAAYARAKRGLMILTEMWAERWAADGIVVNAMHPGWADTPGVQGALPVFRRLTRPVLRSPEQGADTIVWLAAAREAGTVTGQFWLDREPHPSHVLPGTRETAAEREAFLAALEGADRACAPQGGAGGTLRPARGSRTPAAARTPARSARRAARDPGKSAGRRSTRSSAARRSSTR